MEYMKKLEEKIQKVGDVSNDNGESCNSKSSRSHRSKKVVKNPKGIHEISLKVKSHHFLAMSADNYCDWELKVKLLALSFEGYVLIWWNEIALHIKGMMRASIES
ncbi:hypothetical protein CR513_01472, partial [Mucuna pruriens]